MADIKDVAARAGVSIASVSRVLNGSKPVTDHTRDRVLAAVHDLNYSIDQRARSLRRQRSGTLGLILAEVRNPFFTQVIHSIEDVAYQSNNSLFLCNSDENPERERFYLELMQAQRIDGIILLPVTSSGDALSPLLRHDVPVVCLDRRVDDVDLDSVLVDNVAGAMMAVEHLVVLGHRRIGYIGGRLVTPGIERLEGFRRGLTAYGLGEHPELIRQGDSMQESGYRETLALLALDVVPSAIFAINNPMSLGVMAAIKERGLRIPQDISVIGFDDAPWSGLLNPPLTTIAQPTDALGTAAARLLLERIEGGDNGAVQHIVMMPHLIKRASTGPPPIAGTMSPLHPTTGEERGA